MKSTVHASANVVTSTKAYKLHDHMPGYLNYTDDRRNVSYAATTLPLPASRYCDSVAPNEPNPEVIREVIKDLSCVFEKAYGTNVTLRDRSKGLEGEVTRLMKELKCCQMCKSELESEMVKLQSDFKSAQYALDEMSQARVSLEMIVAQLREQLSRLEGTLECETAEKMQLISVVNDLEMKLKNCADTMAHLDVERNQFMVSCKQLEDLRTVSERNGEGQVAELKEALTRCCQQNEAFQQEIDCLRMELENIRRQVETLQLEKQRLLRDFESQRALWANEKAEMAKCIADLKGRLECYELQQKDICEKMTAVINEHHAELDALNNEAEKYKNLCQQLNEELEILRRKLKDCEEQKKQKLLQQQERFVQESKFVTSTGTYNNYNNMSPQFASNQGNTSDCGQNDNQDFTNRLETANSKVLGLEKELQESRINYKEKVSAYEQMQVELEHARAKELELQSLNDELAKSKFAHENAEKLLAQLNKHLSEATIALEEQKRAEAINNEINRNTILDSKKMLDEKMRKLNEYEKKLHETHIELSQAHFERKSIEDKYNLLQKSFEERIKSIIPNTSEAEFYKTEAAQMQQELKESEEKVSILTESMIKIEGSLRDAENKINELSNDNRDTALQEFQICDLKEKLKEAEMEKFRLEEIVKNLEERLQFVQPRLDATSKQRRTLEEKVALLGEENTRLQAAVHEGRDTQDIVQRELRDSKKMWETEVKAKGLLAEKIAKYERMNSLNANNQSSEVDKWKDKCRIIKAELKTEQELVTRLKYKFDQSREQCRGYKKQIEEMASDSKTQLRTQLEEQKLQFEEQINRLQIDRENLISEIHRLGQSNSALKREVKKLTEDIQLHDAEKTTLENIVKSKDRLEVELKNLKRAIDDQYINKSELERLKVAYDMQIAALKSQYEQRAEEEINRKYTEISQYLDQQSRDRLMIDQIRESNENILRTELSSLKKTSELDLDNLRRTVREKEEQIKSERASRNIVNEKFVVEKKKNEDLIKKLQLFRSDSLISINNNEG